MLEMLPKGSLSTAAVIHERRRIELDARRSLKRYALRCDTLLRILQVSFFANFTEILAENPSDRTARDLEQ